uniref:PA domain-containing protein n=1 Tax=Aplanochytrium stocchinoi TaxID=215587 RepID=A0A7S3LJ69_9STRA
MAGQMCITHRGICICICIWLFLVGRAIGRPRGIARPVAIQVTEYNKDSSINLYEIFSSVSSAASVAETKSDAEELELFYFKDGSLSKQQGCVDIHVDIDDRYSETDNGISDMPFALVVKRGGCTFLRKAQIAQAAGAKCLIVVNTEEELYDLDTGIMHDPCTLDCSLGQSSFDKNDNAVDDPTKKKECEASSACESNYCLSNPNPNIYKHKNKNKYCCVVDDVLNMFMGGNETDVGIVISAVFVNIMDGRRLLSSASKQKTTVSLYERPENGSWYTLVILWLFASVVTACASYRAARNDRNKVRLSFNNRGYVQQEQELDGLISQGSNDRENETAQQADKDQDDGSEEVDLDLSSIGGFFIISSVSLIGLFFIVSKFPRFTVITFICLFGLGSIHASSYFCTRPLVRALLPRHLGFSLVRIPKTLRCCFESETNVVTVEASVGMLMAIVMVVVWFVFRHSDTWVWIIQDILSISVTCAFLLNIRIPSLRLATYLLTAFFLL